MEYLATTKWTSVYGLSYSETMKLTHAEWTMMQNKLNDLGLMSLRDLEIPAPKEV